MTKKMKTALVIIFNNPFPGNIPISEKLYGHKFDKIYYLINYQSDDEKIIYVNANSHEFQKFYLQAFDDLKGSDYYFFIHDDVLLNPKFNSKTAFTSFKIPFDKICIRNIDIIPYNAKWNWTWKGCYDVVEKDPFLQEILKENRNYLIKRFQEQILPYNCSRYRGDELEKIICNQSEFLFGHGANADILMMPYEGFKEFIEKLRMINSEGLFVEAAIPTAVLLTKWPIYLMNSSANAPHYCWGKDYKKNNFFYLQKLIKGANIGIHPVKLGKMNWSLLQIFIYLYKKMEGEK